MPVQIGQKLSDFGNPLGLLSDCHRRIERFLEVLSRVARARKGGALIEDETAAFQRALMYFQEAAPKHTMDEEGSLFPRIRDSQAACAIIDELEKDHAVANAAHREVETLGRRWIESGSLDRKSADRLIRLLDRLSALYSRHIAMEDGELFPLAATLFEVDEVTAIGREMAERRALPNRLLVATSLLLI